MKRIITIFSMMILFVGVNGQDVTVKDMQSAGTRSIKSLDSNGWKNFGTIILNLNQGALSNWVAGGEENVFGINGILNYSLNYKMDKTVWDTYLDIAVGFQNATSFERFRKIDDRIDLTSKFGRQISGPWYYGLLTNFNTQLLPGYDYSFTPSQKISNFLAPGRVLISPGFDFRPKGNISVFVSPATVRWIFKRDPDFLNQSKFGVDSSKKVNTEIGAFLTARAILNVTKWATYTGRMDLFSNYRRNPQNVDLLLNNLLTMKFTKSFATNLSLDLIYDDDALKRLQLKEILGIGLTLQF